MPVTPKESLKRWRDANRSKYRAQNSEYERERRAHIRGLAIEAFGGACSRCGFKDQRALQFDHIAGDGASARRSKERLGSFTTSQYKKLAINPEQYINELQVLCANCNWIKRHENQEYR